MALSNSFKLSTLYKTIFGRVADTDHISKTVDQEILTSLAYINPSQIWKEYDDITIPAPGSSDSFVEFYDTTSAVRCKYDPTVSGKRTWVTPVVYANPVSDANTLKNWIPPSVDSTYKVTVYAGDPNVDGIELNANTLNEEWFFDYMAGVLRFPNVVPHILGEREIYITGYRYIGETGADFTGLAAGIDTLNSLTATSQSFATGTTGTDFNISSTSSTHTFNLPTASAFNRGLLSTSDWSSFNNKVPNTRTVTAGSGLTGGGALSSNITLSLSAPVSINQGGTGAITLGSPNKILYKGSGSSVTGVSHTPEFEVSGSNFQIVAGSIAESKLDIDNAPTDTYQLSWDAVSGKMKWVPPGVASGNTLENPGDGDFDDGAVQGWSIGVTTYSKALDDLNEFLGLLIPQAPPLLSAQSISMTGGANSRSSIAIQLCSGVTDNTGGSAPAASTQIYRITTSSGTSSTVSGFGSGNSGTLSALVNGGTSGSRALTSGSDVGVYTSLNITADTAYPPSTPGFWEVLSAYVNSAVSIGVNMFGLSHTETGATNNTIFIRDNDVTPSTSSITLAYSSGSTTNSSGLPHYTSGAILNLSGSVATLISKTYLGSNYIQTRLYDQLAAGAVSSSTGNINPGENGTAAIPAADATPVAFTNKATTISGNLHTNAIPQARGRSSYIDESYQSGSTIVNIMSGTVTSTSTGPIQEIKTPVSVGSVPGGADSDAKRCYIATNSDYPADDLSGLTTTNWSTAQDLSAVGYEHEAVCVGGVLKQSQIDYSTGYLPVGTNYSGKSSTQYATFFFRRSAVSQFDINVTGTYAGLWVRMFDISGLNNTLNGWFDMFQLYAGSGVPDKGGNGPGCALGTVASGSSGTFVCTFGTESSSNSTNNIILVRFRLNSGQSLTGLTFTS